MTASKRQDVDPAIAAALRAFWSPGRKEWVPLLLDEISRRAKCDVHQGLRGKLVEEGFITVGRTPDNSVDYHITQAGRMASGIMEAGI